VAVSYQLSAFSLQIADVTRRAQENWKVVRSAGFGGSTSRDSA
jgi:hypothetical protein